MKIINLTRYNINIFDVDERFVQTVDRSMKVAQLDFDYIISKDSNLPIPLFRTKYGIPFLYKLDDLNYDCRINFPLCAEDIIYIVPFKFLAGFDRADLWEPGELIRQHGQSIDCIGLRQ